MTHDEALNLKSFKHHCTCGGFAASMNLRNAARPHMDWCPQKDEYNEWYDAMHLQEHKHTDECWEPDSGCDMGRNEEYVRVYGGSRE